MIKILILCIKFVLLCTLGTKIRNVDQSKYKLIYFTFKLNKYESIGEQTETTNFSS